MSGPARGNLIPPGNNSINLGNLCPYGEVICSLDDEILSPSGEELDLSDGTFIKLLDKTHD